MTMCTPSRETNGITAGSCCWAGRPKTGSWTGEPGSLLSSMKMATPFGRKSWRRPPPYWEIPGHIGLPEMVYLPSLKKYLLLTWGLHTNFRTPTGSELTILESDKPWGPFFLVQYD